MPEHVHLLLSEPQRESGSTAIQSLKLGVVRSLHTSNDKGFACADTQVSQKQRDLGHPQCR